MAEKMGGRCAVCWIAFVLVIIGGLNWGLVGLGGFWMQNWNVVNLLLGNWPQVEWVVYILVGLAAIEQIFSGNCGACKKMNKM